MKCFITDFNRQRRSVDCAIALNLTKIRHDCMVGLRFQTSLSFSVLSLPKSTRGLTQKKVTHPQREV